MVTITCQYTGVVFEADSRRQKNHPKVSRLLNSCANDRSNPSAYNLAQGALRQAKADGMTDIDAIIAFAESYVREGGDLRRQAENKRRAAQAAADKAFEENRQRIKEERRQRNEFLKGHGYRWSKEFADFDEYEEGEPSQWVLRAPDGRQVDVAQALDEVERGAEVVLAEISQREAAQAEREAEAQRAEQEERNRRESAIVQVRLLGHRCDPFDMAQLPVIYELRKFAVGTHIVRVHLGEIDGVKHGAIYEYWGGHDWTEFIEYWRE